jgi:hypothetical protein
VRCTPVAKAFSIDGDISVGGGVNVAAGYFVILQGVDAGKLQSFGDFGVGGGADISINLKETNIFYTGDIKNFRLNSLSGTRHEFSAGVTINGIDFSGSYFRSEIDDNGGRVIGVSGGVGVGAIPYSLSGGWNYGGTVLLNK